MLAVRRIIIDPNNKNLGSDIGVNAERSEKLSSQPLVLTSMKSSDEMGYPVSTSP